MSSPFLPMTLPSLRQKPAVTETEAKLIWLAAQKRVVAMLIKTLWYAGLRITEALMLTPGDLRREGFDFSLAVWTEKVGKKKGENVSKPDIIPIPREFGLDLYDYVKESGIKPGDPIFPMHRATAWRQIQQCAQRAGLPNWKAIHPHSFRHGFIYDKASKGVHPYVLSQLARHMDLRTTLGYYQPTEKDLREAMEK